MSGAREHLQVKLLKTLDPLSGLSVDKLEEIANKSVVEELPPGRTIFRQGEKDKRCIYLLQGSLELQITGNPRIEVVKAKTVEARYPIAQQWPRPSTCRTKTNAVVLYIDSDLLEILLNEDPSGQYEVTEIGVDEDAESDWMLRFLQSPAFLQLPTDNIQSLLIKLEEIPAKRGDVIVKQGDTDQWYYIVKHGKCTVSRRPAPKADEVRLALLGPGDGFGEEALITDGKRNATITMKEAGTLMRLNKNDFNDLLVKPLLKYIDHAQMSSQLKSGAALIDVRSNKEFSTDGIKTATNIPLSMLRVKARDLNATRPHIVYCNDGTQSSAAAFLLAQQGIEVFILENGLQAQNKPFSVSATAPESEAEPMMAAATADTTSTRIPTIEAKAEPAKPAAPAPKTSVAPAAKPAQKPKQNREFDALGKKSAQNSGGSLQEQSNALKNQAANLAKKTAHAEAEKQRAEQEAEAARLKIEKEREAVMAQAKAEIKEEQQRKLEEAEKEANQLKAKADDARQRAEEELARIKNEADSIARKQSEIEAERQRAEETQRAESAKLELKKLKVKEQEEQAKAKAEEIRQKALKEAEQIRRSMEERKARLEMEEKQRIETEIQAKKRESQMAIQEATKAAEQARLQAEKEAEAIKREAMIEAERLRADLEEEKQRASEMSARKKAEEELRYQQRIEEARQEALNKAKEEAELIRQQAEAARTKAELDAKQMRKQAMEEARVKALEEAQQQAETLKQQAIQEAMQSTQQFRVAAEQEAELIRQQTFEQARSEAISEARTMAEQEAAEIRGKAMAEAQQLKSQMEETRLLVESHAKRAQVQIEQENARLQTEQQQIAKQAEEAARQEAEQARIREMQLKAQQQAEQEDLARQREELVREREHTLRQQAELEAQQKNQESFDQARVMAESIRNKLDKKNTQIQKEEFAAAAKSGPKLATARLHVINDKTVLEGEEDIFVFKAPSERPPSREEAEQLIAQTEKSLLAKKANALPNFDIEYSDDEPADEFVTGTDSEFSDSILLDLDQITTNTASVESHESLQAEKPKEKSTSNKQDDDFDFPEFDNAKPVGVANNRKRSLIALAASVVVMLTVSIAAITQPSYVDVASVDEVYNNSESDNDSTSLASMRAKHMNQDYQKDDAERQIRAEAEKDFQAKLKQLEQ